MSAPEHRSAARAFLRWRKREQTRKDPRFSWVREKPPKRDDSGERDFRNAAAFKIDRMGVFR
jgi:hypothetical protein